MNEQIEVFGQFDVRRNDVEPEPEKGLIDQMTIHKAPITNTFGGDQLNAALEAVKNNKRYDRGYKNKAKKFYISRKDCAVRRSLVAINNEIRVNCPGGSSTYSKTITNRFYRIIYINSN